jgi:tripartite-type tricarboxylate transporter receptor subunit TctC
MGRWRLLLSAASACLLALAPGPAPAQAYPAKPVRILVPAQPGGGLDLVGRTIAQELGRSMAQSFVVENVSGGGGLIATQSVARAAPDGYTLMVGYVGTHGTNPAVRKIPYDAVADFTPVAMVGGTPNLLVVHPSVPAADLKAFIAHARRNAGRLNLATGGMGTLNHLALEQLKADAGFDAVTAHYRGIGPAITALRADQVHVLFPGLAAALPHVRAGSMRPIAVTGRARHPLLPEVPTFEESGFKGYDAVQWYGIVGPARLPAEITQRLNADINKALNAPALRRRLSAEAIEPMPMTPGQFGAFIQADIERWKTLVRERNLVLEE